MSRRCAIPAALLAVLTWASSAPAEEHWSAIAYSKSTTAFGYGVDHPNAEEAKKDALDYMDPNLKDVEIVAAFNSGWAAIVVGKDDHYAILTGKEGGAMTEREIKELVRRVVELSKKAKDVQEGRVVLLLHAKGFLMQHPYAPPEGDHFAAIARSDDGANWGSYGTEDEAKNLRNDDPKARRAVSKNGWCAMAEGEGGWGLGDGASEDEAKDKALADAKQHSKNPRVILTMCSDGGYTRYPSGGFGGGAAAH